MTLTLQEINKQLDYFLEYQKYKLDIISNDIPRWMYSNARYNLPSFEYFIENCINDKGGKYDFTKQNYSSHLSDYCFDLSNATIKKNVNVSCKIIHSMWMGTPFNFDTQINEICQ